MTVRKRPARLTIFQRSQKLLHFFRIAFPAFAPPPERAFADDGDGDDRAGENRPHDWAALNEKLEDNVCEHNFYFLFVGEIKIGVCK
jgi:hypothetical protein